MYTLFMRLYIPCLPTVTRGTFVFGFSFPSFVGKELRTFYFYGFYIMNAPKDHDSEGDLVLLYYQTI